MIGEPIIPDDPEALKPFLREYLGSIAGALQAIGNGQAYPHTKATAKAQYWDDLVASFSSGKLVGAGASAPTNATFLGNIEKYKFSATAMNELNLPAIHILHGIKPGTAIYPHIHWCSPGTNTGVVRWGIEYTFAKGHQQGAGSVFPATQTIYLEQAATGTPYEHQIIETTSGAAISSANIEVDSLFICRVFRDGAHANDTCTDAVFGLMMDLHYQKGYWATRNKSPNFYK